MVLAGKSGWNIGSHVCAASLVVGGLLDCIANVGVVRASAILDSGIGLLLFGGWDAVAGVLLKLIISV